MPGYSFDEERKGTCARGRAVPKMAEKYLIIAIVIHKFF